MLTKEAVIEVLQKKDVVEAVFFTGSYGAGNQTNNSDLDLVIILRKNTDYLRSVYTWIDGMFADVFFFEHDDLKRIREASVTPANSMDGILITWLSKASVAFDKDGLTTALAQDKELPNRLHPTDQEKRDWWQQVNYNLVTNTRYYNANTDVYREALGLRLLYSTSQLVNCFLALRDIAWRGEKEAFAYIKENSQAFFNSYLQFQASTSIEDKFAAYKSMTDHVFPEGYTIWTLGTVVVNGKEGTRGQKSTTTWEGLIS
ncbi:MAG: Polbeta protein [Patescibacteria group bacterium]|nr:Polbeta protein [Patescibacteria group bacterium]